MTMTAQLDAPPIELVKTHIPEVAERLAAVLAAIEAARVAQHRWQAVQEPVPAGPDGQETRRALAADVDALREGRKPTAYAKLVNGRAQVDGERRAAEAYADEVVRDWNLNGHEDASRETRKRLAEQRDQAAMACVESAQAALTAADATGVDDGRRLRAALGHLADLDRHAEEWRNLEALVGWTTWTRPIHNGKAWDPYQVNGAYPNPGNLSVLDDPITHARALADDSLRRQVRDALERRPGLTRTR